MEARTLIAGIGGAGTRVVAVDVASTGRIWASF